MRTKHTGSCYRFLFDSPADFAEECTRVGPRGRYNDDVSWCGGITYARAVEMCTQGDASIVGEMERAFDVYTQQIDLDMPQLRSMVVGCVPNVPNAIAGLPDTMLGFEVDPLTRTAVRLFYDITSSAGITPTQMRARGAAFLGFYEQLRMIRPVELFICSGLDAEHARRRNSAVACIIAIPATLDLGVVGFLMAHAAALRHLAMRISERVGFTGGWPWNELPRGEGQFSRIATELYECAGDDVCAPPIFLHDSLLTQPKAWVETAMKRFTTQQEEAA